jgi:hypothetical protein
MDLLSDIGMWNLVSIHLEILLVSKQDRCTVCVNHTIRSDIIVGRTQWISYVTLVLWNLISNDLVTVLVLVEDRCTVCVERTIGSEIILDAPDGSASHISHVESCFNPFGDSGSVIAR